MASVVYRWSATAPKPADAIAKVGRIYSEIRAQAADDPNKKFSNLRELLMDPIVYTDAYTTVKKRKGVNVPKLVQIPPEFSIDEVAEQVRSGNAIPLKPRPAPFVYDPARFRRRWRAKRKLMERQRADIPGRDTVVLEVMRKILAAIYEPGFSDFSHGYRTDGRNPHSCLRQIRDNVPDADWLMRIDLKQQIQDMEPDYIVGALQRRIEDKYFIKMLRHALKGRHWGFLEMPGSLSDALPPIGFTGTGTNIILDVLDKRMEARINSLPDYRAKARAASAEALNLRGVMKEEEKESLADLLLNGPGQAEASAGTGQYAEASNIVSVTGLASPISVPSANAAPYAQGLDRVPRRRYGKDPPKSVTIKQLAYFRYGTQCVWLFRTPKRFAHETREEVLKTLEELHVQVDPKELKIKDSKNSLRFTDNTIFLGTKIVSTPNRTYTRKFLRLTAPGVHILRRLKETQFAEAGEGTARLAWMHYDKESIVKMFNFNLNRLLEYYAFTSNYSHFCHKIMYLMRTSCARLLSRKHKMRSRAKVYKKWGRDFSRHGLEASMDLRRPTERIWGDFQDHTFFQKHSRFTLVED